MTIPFVTAVVLFSVFMVMAMMFTFSVFAMVLREWIVVFGAFHAGSGKAVSEFNAAYAGDGENGVGNQ